MASGVNNHLVVIASDTVSTGEVQAGAGGQVNVPISFPQEMTLVAVTVRETTGGNLFPVWYNYPDVQNSFIRVKYANLRTSAYTAGVQVIAIFM